MKDSDILIKGVIVPIFVFILAFFTLIGIYGFHPAVIGWALYVPPLYFIFFSLWLSKYFKNKVNALEEKINEPYSVVRIQFPRDSEYTEDMMKEFFATLKLPDNLNTYSLEISLEITSHEGSIAFFIHTPTASVEYMLAVLQNIFPEIILHTEQKDSQSEITPLSFPSHKKKIVEWGYADGGTNFFPIRTYEDMKETDHQHMGILLHILDVLGQGEHIFFQVVVRKKFLYYGKTKKGTSAFLTSDEDPLEKDDEGGFFEFKESENNWREEMREKIEKTIEENSLVKEGEGNQKLDQTGTELLNAMRKKMHSQTYDVGIRAVYSAPEHMFREDIFNALKSIFQPLNIYAFTPLSPKEIEEEESVTLSSISYLRRIFFHFPTDVNRARVTNRLILTGTELATLFHFPSKSDILKNMKEKVARPKSPTYLPL